MTGSQQRCSIIREFKLFHFLHSLIPLLSDLQSRKLPSKQNCIIQHDSSRGSFWISWPQIQVFHPFLKTKHIHRKPVRDFDSNLPGNKYIKFHSTGCKRVPAVTLEAAQSLCKCDTFLPKSFLCRESLITRWSVFRTFLVFKMDHSAPLRMKNRRCMIHR